MYCNIVFMIDIFVISKITQYRYYVIAITDDIEFSVGLPLKEKANPVLLEVANAFVYYVKLQNNLVNQIVISKAGW